MKVSPWQQLVDQEFLLPQRCGTKVLANFQHFKRNSYAKSESLLIHSKDAWLDWSADSVDRFQERHRCIDQPRRHTRFGWRKPHASGVPPGKWGKPYLSILHKYHKQTVPVPYTNIHKLRQCMQDASFALTLIFSYLCPPSRVQRHNSGWCDWESEPLPESLLLHHSRPESLSIDLCNVDHDWSWLIDIKSTYWFNLLMIAPFIPTYALIAASAPCTRPLYTWDLGWRFLFEIRYEVATEGEHRTNSMPAQPGKLQKQIQIHIDIQWQWFKTKWSTNHETYDYALSSSNRFKGVSGEWNEGTIKTAT